jgi:hypothetical protein
MIRWLYSTDARDIGILYLILSGFSGMLGTMMSLLIRLQLMDINQSAVLNIPNQVYNNIITVHALLMIFYLIMPALFGAFGKLKFNILNIKKILIFTNNIKENEDKNIIVVKNEDKNTIVVKNEGINKLNYYLAGLIEANGSIITSKKGNYFPKIVIIFKKNDLKLVEFLQNKYKCGIIIKKDNYILWQIQKISDVKYIIDVINGKMRTPKIYKLYDAINYFKDNNLLELNYPLLPLNNNKIDEDWWLGGFSDGDSGFSIIINERKNLNNYRIQVQYRLEIQQIYKFNNENLNNSFFNIMSLIASYFFVNLLTRSRNKKLKDYEMKIYNSYILIISSINSWNLLINYFNKYPLLSSKRRDYLDCCKILELKKETKLTRDYIKKTKEIKSSFSNKNKSINWDHLNNI